MICLLKRYLLLRCCNNNTFQSFWILSRQQPKVKLVSKLPVLSFSTSQSFGDAIKTMPKSKPKHKKGTKHKSKEHNNFTSETHHATTADSLDTTKKKLKKKQRHVKDDASEITKAFAKLNVTAEKKAIQKSTRQSSSTSTRNLSHSAGSSRSSRTNFSTLEDVARLILSNRAKNIVVMCGAGISTASGIPDFRSPGTGLYDNLQRYKIPYPTAVFDLDYFYAKPKPFFELAKELYPSGKYRPNIAHYFLRSLHEKGLLLRLYTQNIDGLERLAGIPSSKLVEAHGTFTTATCTKCGKKYNGEQIKKKILKGIVPRCELTSLCWGVIKPDIVFFGEDLPKRFYYYLKDFPLCDMLIVMGTSLEVEPFASLVASVRHNVPRLLLNREKVGPFKSRRRSTDIVATGELAETIRRFSTVLGWKSFVQDMMENHEKEAIEKENALENQSHNQTDSGISSASSVSSDQQKESTPKKSLPPVGDNVKRYFHTLRSTPLPRFASEGSIRNDSRERTPIPSTVSYYDFIRNSTKSNNHQPRKNEAPSSKFRFPDNALQLLDLQTLAKANAPVIQYARVEKQKGKRTSRRILSSVSTPALRKSSKTSSESSESESDSSDSNSSSDF